MELEIYEDFFAASNDFINDFGAGLSKELQSNLKNVHMGGKLLDDARSLLGGNVQGND